MDTAGRIDPRTLQAALHDGGEIALLDAREEVPFDARHLLMAGSVTAAYVPRELGLDGVSGRCGLEPRFIAGHISGAWYAIRARLAEAFAALPATEAIVFTSPDGVAGRLAAAE